ncbi:RAVE subunit 2/Rogdi [Pseudoneurospora amorphoporcata]|uniref:RAVE subunit 2/Rogdi n=1 Tax=Pseudoneurospora amorphoporcata TaxID=241081 RepID=A0AAN6SGZ8_9PEZI|nr:RAVE subunit 2/Rogdi [Pseudoneurospora amorphoporcata]
MSVEIWPPIAPDHLKTAVETSQKRELDWLVQELRESLTNLKHGLEDCYALLAPIDPGSTLVLSTPRNEIVKGHITRVGTRIVKGTIHLRLRTLPQQTLTINPDHPIHLAPLVTLHTLLTYSLDLLTMTLSFTYPTEVSSSDTASSTSKTKPSQPPPQISSAAFLSSQLRLLSQSISESCAILKGPPLVTAADPSWTTRSIAPSHFIPPLTAAPASSHKHNNHNNPDATPTIPPISFHLSIQESSIVLWLRSLEAANAPVGFGTKLAFAIGTARRLEHDEADRVFGFCCAGEEHIGGPLGSPGGVMPESFSSEGSSSTRSGTTTTTATTTTTTTTTGGTVAGRKPQQQQQQQQGQQQAQVDVYVREKVRVETADPSLLSLAAKLNALGHALGLTRRNLAAVMGEEELED